MREKIAQPYNPGAARNLCDTMNKDVFSMATQQ